MAVRCAGCGRLSRDERNCEWCAAEIPPEVRRMAAVALGARGAGARVGGAGRVVASDPVETAVREEERAAAVEAPPEREVAAGDGTIAGDTAVSAAELPAEIVRQQENATKVVWALILLQLGLTLYLGQLSSWWSLTGFLWLAVGYGFQEHFAWALALPLVLFTLDVAFLLFGIGPRERAGFYSPALMDFLLLLLRLATWGLIWHWRDELDADGGE
jgi:hypothetical protein